jgi:hypothetical protein
MAEGKSFWGTVGAIAGALTAIVGLTVAIRQCNREDPAPAMATHQQVQQGDVGLSGQGNSQEGLAGNQQKMQDEIEELKRQLAQKSSEGITDVNEVATNIAGNWRDPIRNGAYTFVQQGNQFTVEEFSNYLGNVYVSAVGSGVISGRRVSFNYTTSNSTGSCSLQLSSDGRSMEGTFMDNMSGASAGITMVR